MPEKIPRSGRTEDDSWKKLAKSEAFPYPSCMIVDIVVAAVVLLSALVSFLRGFIREVLTIFGVVGGITAAFIGAPVLIPLMRVWLDVKEDADPEKLFDLIPMTIVADVTAYGAIFIVVVLVLSLVSHVLSGAAKAMGLGPVDRTLGVMFGIVRGVLLLGLLYLPFHITMDEETKKGISEGSQTFFYIEKTSEILAGFLPEYMKKDESLKPAEDKIETRLKELDILRSDPQTAPKPDPEPLQNGEGSKGEGYQNDEREKLENLFNE